MPDTAKPNIQVDDAIREMTDAEYKALLASGWTDEAPEENTDPA